MGDKRRIGKQFHVIVPNKCDGGGVEVFWAFGVGETGEGCFPKLGDAHFCPQKNSVFRCFFSTK